MHSIHGDLCLKHHLWSLLIIVSFSRTSWRNVLLPPLVTVLTSSHHICRQPDLLKLIFSLLPRQVEFPEVVFLHIAPKIAQNPIPATQETP
jgi:hypothetical protein